MVFGRKFPEKLLDAVGANIGRMLGQMEFYVANDPAEVRLFRMIAVMLQPHGLADLVEKPRPFSCGFMRFHLPYMLLVLHHLGKRKDLVSGRLMKERQ